MALAVFHDRRGGGVGKGAVWGPVDLIMVPVVVFGLSRTIGSNASHLVQTEIVLTR